MPAFRSTTLTTSTRTMNLLMNTTAGLNLKILPIGQSSGQLSSTCSICFDDMKPESNPSPFHTGCIGSEVYCASCAQSFFQAHIRDGTMLGAARCPSLACKNVLKPDDAAVFLGTTSSEVSVYRDKYNQVTNPRPSIF